MRVKTLVSIGLLLLLLLMLCATPVYANGIPALPHAFHGTVTINGSSAPTGTTVSATGTGVMTNIPQNPVTTTVTGQYGTGGLYLLVQGDILDGATITFYVNGRSTGQTAEWHSGETTELPLSVTITAPAAPPAPPGAIETTLFSVEFTFSIDSDTGEVLETITATSADGNLTITIPEGTIALDEEGNPLSTLTSDVDPSPPDPPEGANIIGLAYDFGPPGATFDPPLTLEYTYDPDALPEGVDEENLVLAYYDEEAGEWVELDCEVDIKNNTITASVAHFTTFAIIGVVTPPEEEEVAPPEEEVMPPEEEVAPPEEEVAPPEEEIVPPEEEVTPPAKPGVNWLLIGGIIGGVIVVALLIFLFVRRRE